jgi:hypothetical protein
MTKDQILSYIFEFVVTATFLFGCVSENPQDSPQCKGHHVILSGEIFNCLQGQRQYLRIG